MRALLHYFRQPPTTKAWCVMLSMVVIVGVCLMFVFSSVDHSTNIDSTRVFPDPSDAGLYDNGYLIGSVISVTPEDDHLDMLQVRFLSTSGMVFDKMWSPALGYIKCANEVWSVSDQNTTELLVKCKFSSDYGISPPLYVRASQLGRVFSDTTDDHGVITLTINPIDGSIPFNDRNMVVDDNKLLICHQYSTATYFKPNGTDVDHTTLTLHCQLRQELVKNNVVTIPLTK